MYFNTVTVFFKIVDGKIVNVDKDLEIGTKAINNLKENSTQALMRKCKVVGMQSSSINDITIGVILIHTRVTGQPA